MINRWWLSIYDQFERKAAAGLNSDRCLLGVIWGVVIIAVLTLYALTVLLAAMTAYRVPIY
jgi:hypothetical protein